MDSRHLSPLDKLICGIDNALRSVGAPHSHSTRPNPAEPIAEHTLSDADKRHAAGLMRVNHAGEVAAQGLYQGHAAVARDPAIEQQMTAAAEEELDHLGWCEQRLTELDSQPSVLGPVWYGGAFVLGAASGMFGDKWSLGFIQETEHQVSTHLTGHLDKLPQNDAKSRAIVRQMRDEEEQHGANAAEAGAAALPRAVRQLMTATARIMTTTAYRI